MDSIMVQGVLLIACLCTSTVLVLASHCYYDVSTARGRLTRPPNLVTCSCSAGRTDHWHLQRDILDRLDSQLLPNVDTIQMHNCSRLYLNFSMLPEDQQAPRRRPAPGDGQVNLQISIKNIHYLNLILPAEDLVLPEAHVAGQQHRVHLSIVNVSQMETTFHSSIATRSLAAAEPVVFGWSREQLYFHLTLLLASLLLLLTLLLVLLGLLFCRSVRKRRISRDWVRGGKKVSRTKSWRYEPNLLPRAGAACDHSYRSDVANMLAMSSQLPLGIIVSNGQAEAQHHHQDVAIQEEEDLSFGSEHLADTFPMKNVLDQGGR